MIFIGYQGIGKSCLAERNINFIDLESSNFWYDYKGEKKRDPYWYLPYCSIAENLSAQGYDVFVSSHSVVRDRLAYSQEYVVTIYPAPYLKDEWIEKLQKRYEASHSDKDYKAWMNAKDRYLDNIQELKDSAVHDIVIQSMNYHLDKLIYNYQKRKGRAREEMLYDERGVARYQRI